MGTTVHGVGKGGSGFLDLVNNLRGGGPGGPVVWVVDVGDDTIHWEGVGMVPPQGGPQAAPGSLSAKHLCLARL